MVSPWTPRWSLTCAACLIFYETALLSLTGHDLPVIEFLEAEPDVLRMRSDIACFISDWLSCYIKDGRSYLTIGIGCTGRQHRSVYIAEWLGRQLLKNLRVLVRHRELQSDLSGTA